MQLRRVLIPVVLFASPLFLPADLLWNRAVDAYPRSLQWVPATIEVLTEQYNGGGDLRSRARVVSERRVSTDGEVSYEVVESEQMVGRGDPESGFPGFPGDDEATEDDPERFAAVGASPFDPELQEQVSYRRTGNRRSFRGETAVAFSFQLELEGDARAHGTAWLDPDSGLPLRVERTVEPPIAVIRSFEVEESYRPQDDHWRLNSFSVDVVGRVLFVERRVLMNMAFRDHVFDPEGFNRQR